MSCSTFAFEARSAPDGLADTIWATSDSEPPPRGQERQRRREQLRRHREQLRSRPDAAVELFASRYRGRRLAEEIQEEIRSSGRVLVRAVGALSTMTALKVGREPESRP